MACRIRKFILNKKSLIRDIIVFFMVSAIPLWFTFRLMFSSPLTLPGVDPAQHIAMIRLMIKSRSFLVPYSQFFLTNANMGYYPAVWQGFIAILHVLSGVSEVELIRYFISLIFLLGAVAIWFISRELSKDDYLKSVFIYFLVLFSCASMIKTLRDGSFGEIICMWFLFPSFLYSFLRRKVWLSVLAFVTIIAIHNLSTMMVGLWILSYLISERLSKEAIRKFTLRVMTFSFILALPVIYYNYLLTFFGVITDKERSHALGAPYLLEMPLNLTELTFYTGIACLIAISIFYKRLRWIPLWFGMYLLGYVIFGQARFVREMFFPIALSIGIVLYDSIDKVFQGIRIRLPFREPSKELRLPKSMKLKLLTLLSLSLIVAYNGVRHISVESAPIVTDYFTQNKWEAYNWLNDRTTIYDNTLVVRALDSWARVYLKHNVYEVWSVGEQTYLSTPDRRVNEELTRSLLYPFSADSLQTFRKYNITYFILSAPLNGRWYPLETPPFAEELLKIEYESSHHYELIYHFKTSEETIKIYRIIYI